MPLLVLATAKQDIGQHQLGSIRCYHLTYHPSQLERITYNIHVRNRRPLPPSHSPSTHKPSLKVKDPDSSEVLHKYDAKTKISLFVTLPPLFL